MRRIIKALALVAAPLPYAIGRLTGNPALAARAVDLDTHYLRAYASRLEANHLYSEMFGRFAQAAKICASANRLVDDEMNILFPRSHGQLLQDIVCILIHKQKRGGYFVEVGVGDGTTYSNTLMLERDFGWRGVLAEPAITFHDKISRSRTSVLDRRAVSTKSGSIVTFEEDSAVGEFSGLADTRTVRGKQELSTYQVETVSLDDLLEEHAAPDEIDYISIDTEGSEIDILKGLSLTRRRIGLFTVEHNFDPVRMAKYDEIFEPAGYRKILPHLSGFDFWYIHRKLATDIF